MSKPRVLLKRRRIIRSLRKITRTMNLIATTRYQKNVQRIVAFRPFAQQVRAAVGDVLAACPGIDHPLLHGHAPANPRTALVVLTSDRGLCGAFNVNVLRAAEEFVAVQTRAGTRIELYVLGRKGMAYFSRRNRPIAGKYESAAGRGVPTYEQVRVFAGQMIDRFLRGQIDELGVALTRFHSAGRQENKVVQILPLPAIALQGEWAGRTAIYDVSPGPQALLDELLPAAVNVTMFQAVLEAAASEQFIRMISMKSATDNADRMIKSLTLKYNRARQAQITTELCEIIGAAEVIR